MVYLLCFVRMLCKDNDYIISLCHREAFFLLFFISRAKEEGEHPVNGNALLYVLKC